MDAINYHRRLHFSSPRPRSGEQCWWSCPRPKLFCPILLFSVIIHVKNRRENSWDVAVSNSPSSLGEESIRGIDKTKLEHEFGRNKSWQSFRAQPHDQTRPDQFTYYIISNYYCYSVLNERRRSWNTKENNKNFVIAGGGVNILRMQSLARDLLPFLSMFLIYFVLAPLAIGEMKR